MNYEIQFRLNVGGAWLFWSSTHPLIKCRKKHIEHVRDRFRDRKFRIVRVTRKVVKG